MAKTSGGLRVDKNALAKALANTENAIRGGDYESLGVFDSKGRRLVFATGDKSSVGVTAEEEKYLRNAIVTHNHPGGTSFSSGDLKTMVAFNSKELRVVTRDYTYSMKRPKGGWGKDVDSMHKTITDIYWRKFNELGKYQSAYKGNKDVARIRANQLHHHLFSKEVAKTFGWEYTKMRVKK